MLPFANRHGALRPPDRPDGLQRRPTRLCCLDPAWVVERSTRLCPGFVSQGRQVHPQVLHVPVGGTERLLMVEVHVREGIECVRPSRDLEQRAVRPEHVAEPAVLRSGRLGLGNLCFRADSCVRGESRTPHSLVVGGGREEGQMIYADGGQPLPHVGRIGVGSDVPEGALSLGPIQVLPIGSRRGRIHSIEEDVHVALHGGVSCDLGPRGLRPDLEIPLDRRVRVHRVEHHVMQARHRRDRRGLGRCT